MKILIIRFSSFGDVTQCLSVPSAFAARFPGAEIHWVTRADFASLLSNHPQIQRIWGYEKSSGQRGLWKLIRELRKEKFDLIYDAHNNLRSRQITLLTKRFSGPEVIRRSLKRWKRFLLFRLRWNLFEQPFSGQRDLLEPLEKLGIPKRPSPPVPQLFLSSEDHEKAQALLKDAPKTFWACAASSAHELKKWPTSHWQELIRGRPQDYFVLLGGPDDHFYSEIAKVAPDRVLNLAGKAPLTVSAAVIQSSKGLIANDTGLLHVAEQLGVPAIAMMGPAPFGFPSRERTRILEIPLNCRPCSKHGQGPCVNEKFHRCMVDLTPDLVSKTLDGFPSELR